MSEESRTENDISISEDEFKIAVKNYVTISDEIDEIQRIVKEKKQRMKKLGEFILSFMQEKDKEICNLGDSGTIERKVKKRKQTLNKSTISKLLNEVLKNETLVKSSVDYIFENQETIESEVLCRNK